LLHSSSRSLQVYFLAISGDFLGFRRFPKRFQTSLQVVICFHNHSYCCINRKVVCTYIFWRFLATFLFPFLI
jgi:hypothetical protein